MTQDKDSLIIELGSILTKAAKIYAEITKDHSPTEQSVEKRTQEVFGESSVTVSSITFKCPYCDAVVNGPHYFYENQPESEYWKCTNNAVHCSGAVQGKKLKDDGTPFLFAPSFARYYYGKLNTPENNKNGRNHFPSTWEEALQNMQEVNDAAAEATDSHPFDESSDDEDTLNAEDIF